MDPNRRPGRSDLRRVPEDRARSCQHHVRTTTEGTGDRSRARTGTHPARGIGRSHHRFVARPALPPHLQRRAAGRAGGCRGCLHRGGGERPLRRSALRAAAAGRVQLPGRPHQRGRPRRQRRRGPRAPGTGQERRCRGRAGCGPAVRRHPRGGGRRRRRPPGRDLQGRDHPLPAVPGLAAGRTDCRPGRIGRGRTGPQMAAARARPRGHRLRPLRRRAHGEPRGAPGPGGRGLPARAGDSRDDRDDRGRAVRLDAGRGGLHQHGPGPAP